MSYKMQTGSERSLSHRDQQEEEKKRFDLHIDDIERKVSAKYNNNAGDSSKNSQKNNYELLEQCKFQSITGGLFPLFYFLLDYMESTRSS